MVISPGPNIFRNLCTEFAKIHSVSLPVHSMAMGQKIYLPEQHWSSRFECMIYKNLINLIDRVEENLFFPQSCNCCIGAIVSIKTSSIEPNHACLYCPYCRDNMITRIEYDRAIRNFFNIFVDFIYLFILLIPFLYMWHV